MVLAIRFNNAARSLRVPRHGLCGALRHRRGRSEGPPTRVVLPAFPIAVVLRVTASVSDGPWWPNTNLNAQLSHSVKVSFDKGVEVENREVISTLRWIHKHIRDTVFQRLEQYL